MEDAIRIGVVSAYNVGTGMASVYYMDRGETTGDLPILLPFGVTQPLIKGEAVVVAQLGGGRGAIILGRYGGKTGASIQGGNELTFSDSSGSVKLSEIERQGGN